MKKVFVFIALMLFVIIILPSAIVFIFSEKVVRETDTDTTEDIQIKVSTDEGLKEFELEKYLFGVLTGEMPASFHEEALKAQAVAARTYIINKTKTRNPDHPDADVCTDPTHCKAYLDDEKITEKLGADWVESYGDKINSAIKSTEKEILVYNGEPIQAVFHSTSNGKTENAVDVWGNAVPYLVSVDSPGDAKSPKYSDEITVSKKVIAEKILEKRNKVIEVYIGNVSYNDSGSVGSIDLGGEVFTGIEVREMFSLPSATFTVENSEENFIFHTRGKGHGVGMSQYGAEYYAENGMDYKEILKTYYKGTEVVKYGEDNDKGNKD